MGEWKRVQGEPADPETYEILIGGGERLRVSWGVKDSGERWYDVERLKGAETVSQAYYGTKSKDGTRLSDEETFLHDDNFDKLLDHEETLRDASLPPEKKSGLEVVIYKLKQVRLRKLSGA